LSDLKHSLYKFLSVCVFLSFRVSLRMYLVVVLDDKHSLFKFLFGFLYFWFLPFCLFDVNNSWNQSKFYVTCCPFVFLSFYLSALMSVHRCIYCLFILSVCLSVKLCKLHFSTQQFHFHALLHTYNICCLYFIPLPILCLFSL
jgi:hypothetical protein